MSDVFVAVAVVDAQASYEFIILKSTDFFSSFLPYPFVRKVMIHTLKKKRKGNEKV